MPKKKVTPAPLPRPSHLVYRESIHLPNKGEFVPGDTVWVQGWSRSKRANYTLKKIVENSLNGESWVDIWESTPSVSRMRSVNPQRLGKRRTSA